MDKREQPVIILSTGRAGSTLLQKLLNTHGELTIWGEHAGIFNPLVEAWRAVSGSEWIPEAHATGAWMLEPDRPVHAERWTAWDGSFSKVDFRRSLKHFVEDLFCRDLPLGQRWGFKEIRYRQIDFIDLFVELFAQARFILLMRNPVDSCVSFATAFARRDQTTPQEYGALAGDIARNQIKPVFPFFRAAFDKYPDRTLGVCYEDLVADPTGALERIAAYLGLDAGFDAAAVQAVMAKKLVSEEVRASSEQMQAFRELATAGLADEVAWYASIRR